ncbi:hypothetical protein A0H76_1721 [Hepatospora eriocheir]|uniref:Uncharacterized protein n=1 Tax=Hepatospora eriocheir TaxID=1081669 RepID=A0A1X0QGL0_9MICR|nr:hypothetical protein A0H76_1721 [Hepatospora eriocheir]
MKNTNLNNLRDAIVYALPLLIMGIISGYYINVIFSLCLNGSTTLQKIPGINQCLGIIIIILLTTIIINLINVLYNLAMKYIYSDDIDKDELEDTILNYDKKIIQNLFNSQFIILIIYFIASLDTINQLLIRTVLFMSNILFDILLPDLNDSKSFKYLYKTINFFITISMLYLLNPQNLGQFAILSSINLILLFSKEYFLTKETSILTRKTASLAYLNLCILQTFVLANENLITNTLTNTLESYINIVVLSGIIRKIFDTLFAKEEN